MSDEAAKDLGTVVQRLARGWPVYGVVFAAMLAYSELWIDAKIDAAISAGVGGTSPVTMLQGDVQVLTAEVDNLGEDVVRLDGSIVSLNDDVKETLRILATQ